MIRSRVVGLGWALSSLCLALAAPAHGAAVGTAAAESLFVAGEFDASDRAFARLLEARPSDTLALVRRGHIALLENRTAEARTWAAQALRAGASGQRMALLRAESFHREDRFDSAAAAFREAGRPALAAKLEALRQAPYAVRGPQRASVRFEQTDPLPLVPLAVNGRGPFLFLIDTGGGELILDPAIADSVGARRFGPDSSLFAGDRRAAFEHGSVDSVGIGDMVVARVPVRILATKRFSSVAGGRFVAGVLGTTLLSRFRFTLDYPGGALVLERRGSPPSREAPPPVELPFWLAGDHFILARGSLGASGPLLWFIDTGLAGAAFTAPAATLAEAGMALRDTLSFTGQGGGGAVRVVPFRVDRLRLGSVEQSNLLAMLGPFPATLERSLGPRVAGIVSHAFLRPYRVTFDFDRLRILLARPS